MRMRSFPKPSHAGPETSRGRSERRAVQRPARCDLDILEGRQLMSTFTVSNLHHAGPGSPRHAIVQSHRSAGPDAVRFDVDGTIRLAGTTDSPSLDVHRGDVVRIDAARSRTRGHQAANVSYYDTSSVTMQPVSGWQGIRGADAKGQYLITGTSNANGILFVGSIAGQGTSYSVNVPGASTTSVYGPDNRGGGQIALVGSYKNADASTSSVAVHGFLFQGTTADLPSGGSFRTIDYPNARFNYVHSTSGGLAVGNADGPTASGQPLGPGTAYIYDIAKNAFVANVVYPGSTSNTAYGIWHNGGTSYTICGGYSTSSVGGVAQGQPIGQAYLVDYNSATGRFTHWTSFNYPNGGAGRDFITHFEGISGGKNGVYTLSADSVQAGTSNPDQGSVVTVRRNANGTFGRGAWVDLNYPGVPGITSSNSVFKNQVVGIVIGSSGLVSYQATVGK